MFVAGFYFLFLKTAPQIYAWMVLPFITPLSQQIVATVLEYKSQCKWQWTLDSWIFPFTGVAPLFLLRHYRSALPDEMTQSIPLGVWEDLGHLFTDTFWEIQGVCTKYDNCFWMSCFLEKLQYVEGKSYTKYLNIILCTIHHWMLFQKTPPKKHHY